MSVYKPDSTQLLKYRVPKPLQSLVNLDLSNSSLVTIPPFADCINLREINLSKNNIAHIRNEFTQNKNLLLLKLKNNPLRSILIEGISHILAVDCDDGKQQFITASDILSINVAKDQRYTAFKIFPTLLTAGYTSRAIFDNIPPINKSDCDCLVKDNEKLKEKKDMLEKAAVKSKEFDNRFLKLVENNDQLLINKSHIDTIYNNSVKTDDFTSSKTSSKGILNILNSAKQLQEIFESEMVTVDKQLNDCTTALNTKIPNDYIEYNPLNRFLCSEKNCDEIVFENTDDFIEAIWLDLINTIPITE